VKTETQINEGTMIHARDNTHNPRSVKLLLEISVSVFLPVCVCVREKGIDGASYRESIKQGMRSTNMLDLITIMQNLDLGPKH
jgi:hypothetical protein